MSTNSNPKPRRIPRRRFETAGWRTITVACGDVTWPDGRVSRYNVRLQANSGEDGDVYLISEDVNSTVDRTIKLRRDKE